MCCNFYTSKDFGVYPFVTVTNKNAQNAGLPRIDGSEDSTSFVEQQLVFRRPAVRVDAVQNVSGVVVDCAECANDPETLVASGLYAGHALVEGSVYQNSTCLTHRHRHLSDSKPPLSRIIFCRPKIRRNFTAWPNTAENEFSV